MAKPRAAASPAAACPARTIKEHERCIKPHARCVDCWLYSTLRPRCCPPTASRARPTTSARPATSAQRPWPAAWLHCPPRCRPVYMRLHNPAHCRTGVSTSANSPLVTGDMAPEPPRPFLHAFARPSRTLSSPWPRCLASAFHLPSSPTTTFRSDDADTTRNRQVSAALRRRQIECETRGGTPSAFRFPVSGHLNATCSRTRDDWAKEIKLTNRLA